MTNPGAAVARRDDPVSHPVAPLAIAPERVRVWDPFVRYFHWSLTGAVLVAYAALCLVPLDLLGVAVASFQHKENLIRSMIDGYQRKLEHP